MPIVETARDFWWVSPASLMSNMWVGLTIFKASLNVHAHIPTCLLTHVTVPQAPVSFLSSIWVDNLQSFSTYTYKHAIHTHPCDSLSSTCLTHVRYLGGHNVQSFCVHCPGILLTSTLHNCEVALCDNRDKRGLALANVTVRWKSCHS